METSKIIYVAIAEGLPDPIGSSFKIEKLFDICDKYMGTKHSKWKPMVYSEHEDPYQGKLIYYDGDIMGTVKIYLVELFN